MLRIQILKMKVLRKIFIFIVLFVFDLSNGMFVENNETKSTDKRSSSTKWTDPYDELSGVWSQLLEDYTLNKTNRMSRIERQFQRYIPASEIYITRRIDEMEVDSHRRPILPRIGNLPNHLAGNGAGTNGPFMPSNFNRQGYPSVNQPLREVSETDLYLLGAIEKLVYRVDYLENRVRRSEQLIYYLMAGNNQNKKEVLSDPCPKNFTRVGDNCYLISDRQLNWKSANSLCKSMSAHLAEFEAISENEEIIAFILNHPQHRGKDFWLGGLNPGLLWIWSNSAKPVNPNTNLTTIANSAQNSTKHTDDNRKNESDKKILNNITEIKGNGRCLRLSYNPPKHTYFYYGQECTSRQNYLCEYEDKTVENQIKKVGRDLQLF